MKVNYRDVIKDLEERKLMIETTLRLLKSITSGESVGVVSQTAIQQTVQTTHLSSLRKVKQTKKRTHYSDEQKLADTKEGYLLRKKQIGNWRQASKLTVDDLNFFSNYGGKIYEELSPLEKKSFIDKYKEIQQRLRDK